MTFKEFKRKNFGKSYDIIKKNLKEEKDFWKNTKDMSTILIDINKLIQKIIKLDKEFPSLYDFKKRTIILNYIYDNFTTLETIPDIDIFDEYDYFVEKAIYEVNREAAMVKEMVENGIYELRMVALDELYSIFKDGVPTIEELEGIKTSLKDIFSNEDPEKLKIIENILAFNDPTMKQLRDIVTDTSVDLETQTDIFNTLTTDINNINK